MKQLHMVCNAHLDPVWLWEWEEGAAEALSTFRVAADFCEQYQGFVFNHNEALLYQWVEEYEPALFERIRRLVKDGRWHIMGGWYLQPDCVMPNGESITRQILRGRQYFEEKFGKAPETAINFDSFGHSRGLVQILIKSGYSSYVMCRPGDVKNELEQNDLIWKGFDGSEVLVHHCADAAYSTRYGEAAETMEPWMEKNAGRETGLWLWGVGDHGGGPSRKDLEDLQELMQRHPETEILHSTPEAYFETLDRSKLPVWDRPLTPELFGCYVSLSRIKKMHRALEDRLYATEKLLSLAAVQKLLPYPKQEMQQAEKALLFAEFHDILPGSCIPSVETAALDKISYGMEILSQLRMKAVFALSQGLPQVKQGESTLLVYNPHPYEIEELVQCELMTAQQNFSTGFLYPTVWQDGQRIPSQPGVPETSMWIDWRKKVIFRAKLKPCSVTRFDCRFEMSPARPRPETPQGDILFDNGEMQVRINHLTGRVDRYCRNGKPYLEEGSFALNVYDDGFDTWHFGDPYSKALVGAFELMSPEECAEFCAVPVPALPPVHVAEDGEVRMVVESALKHRSSKMLLRYILPKQGGELGIEIRLFWQEKNKIAKLVLNTALAGAQHCGQTIWGTQNMDATGREDVCLRWCGLKAADFFLTVINNGACSSSVGENGELRLPLLRSAAYGTSDSEDGVMCNRPDYCYKERMDQGECCFSFWLQGQEPEKRAVLIDREAQVHGEAPYALALNPSGTGKAHTNGLLSIEHPSVLLEALKPAEDGNGFVLRIRNPLDTSVHCTVRFAQQEAELELGAFEVQTWRLNPADAALTQTELLT